MTKLDQVDFAHSGKSYAGVLKLLNNVLSPRRFFEIGTRGGQSLRQFACDAVCVDPRFFIKDDPILTRKRTFFFQMSSDAFFAEYQPSKLLGGPIDIAFLDGFHRYEYLLRDFINTERECHGNSLIILHDCLPPHPFMTRRSGNDGVRISAMLDGKGEDAAVSKELTAEDLAAASLETDDVDQSKEAAGDAPAEPKKMGWSGDVYRMLFILKQFRPDLRVTYYDCPPTGLVVVSRLNPSSTELSDKYFEAVDMAAAIKLTFPKLEELYKLYPMVKTQNLDADFYSMHYAAFS